MKHISQVDPSPSAEGVSDVTKEILRILRESGFEIVYAHKIKRMQDALRQIADWCPATQEMTLAHQMAEEAEAALSDAGQGALK